MKIKFSTIGILLIYLVLFCGMSYPKLLGEAIPMFSTSYVNNYLLIFYIALITFAVVWSKVFLRKINGVITFEVGCILLAIISGITKAASVNGLKLLEGLSEALPYFMFLLSIPIYTYFSAGKLDFHKFLKWILVWGAGALLIRWFISSYYGIAGEVIFRNIAEESAAEDWIRNDVLRINPAFVGILLIPIAYYFLTKVKSKRGIKKLIYFLPIVISLGFSIFVHQARSIIAYQIICIVLMIFYDNQKITKKNIVPFVIFIVLLIVAVNSTYIQDFIGTFSTENTDYGGSTLARLNAIAFFGARYLNTPFWGIGFLDYLDQSAPIGGHITDIGVLGGVYTLGIPILIAYIMIFVRGFVVAARARKNRVPEGVLVFGLTALLLMNGININCFMMINAMAVPVVVATTEYVNCKCMRFSTARRIEGSE